MHWEFGMSRCTLVYIEWINDKVLLYSTSFPFGTVVKYPLASAGDVGDIGSIPGSGRSPGGGNGNPLSILAWKIPRTEEHGGLQSMRSQRVGHD